MFYPNFRKRVQYVLDEALVYQRAGLIVGALLIALFAFAILPIQVVFAQAQIPATIDSTEIAERYAISTLIFSESFETDGNGTRYTTSIPEFTDNSFDFFNRTDGSNITGSYNVTGVDGSFFFAAQDIDGEGADSQQTLSFTDINISGFTNLNFSALFAEDDDGSNQDWDPTDFVKVEYQIDGGGFQNLFAIENDGAAFNSAPFVDTDFDGTGDGAEITDIFTSHGNAIAGTGASLDLRITFDLNSGDEDIAIDYIQIDGDSGSSGGTTLSIAATDANKAEGDVGNTDFTFTATRSGDTTGATDVDYTVTSSAADAADFGGSLPSGTVSFAANSTSEPINIPVSGDLDAEANEDFTVTLSNPTGGATITTAAANGTIQNDDGVLISFIHEVQGSGTVIALNEDVTVSAIVVGDFQADDQLNGFFIQEEDLDADADVDTSEGIFVYCGGCATDVAVGDLVEVTGLAKDFFGMSQIDVPEAGGSVTVINSGNTLPTPTSIDLPASGSTEAEATFESVEGMLVQFVDELFVSEYFELARYGQLVLTADAVPHQFTDESEPSVAGYAAFLSDLEAKRIILDNDNNTQNDPINTTPDTPYFWPRPGLSTTNFVRGGDSITNLTGVLHWSFAGQGGTDAWRVRPVADPSIDYTFTSNNARTATPDSVGGTFKVASFNVLNYFTTINSRGADSTAELDRQREKIAAAICAIDADVVGLIEIENNGTTAINDLLAGTNGVNANCGPYAAINTGTIGTDQIAVAFIYKTATASPVGSHAILDSTVDPRFIDTKNRPALAQTFEENTTGGALTVVVNHLKSKGSACDDVGDPGLDDGAANCNLTRADAAAAMVDWLATDPTNSGDPDFLIIGDLNAYRNEDPIDNIEVGSDDTAGTSDDYTDLLDSFIGSSAYSYVFDGQRGYLDYALAVENLLPQVAGVTSWNINADEIPVFDYNDEILDGSNESSFERESDALPIYESNAFRASDHDPIIVGLNLMGATAVRSQMTDSLGSYTYDQNGSGGSMGELTINFNFLYNSGSPLDGVNVGITTANNATVLNVDEGNGGVGSKMYVADAELPGSNGLFEETETLTVEFVIGIDDSPWGVNFELYATENGVNSAGIGESIGSFTIDSSMIDLSSALQMEPSIFLPFVQ